MNTGIAMKFHNDVHNSVRIATGYGLNGGGSIPGRDTIFLFSTASKPALGFTQPPIQWVQKGKAIPVAGHEGS
jgi:hypothetical protein